MERRMHGKSMMNQGRKMFLDFLKNTGNSFLPAKLNANV